MNPGGEFPQGQFFYRNLPNYLMPFWIKVKGEGSDQGRGIVDEPRQYVGAQAQEHQCDKKLMVFSYFNI